MKSLLSVIVLVNIGCNTICLSAPEPNEIWGIWKQNYANKSYKKVIYENKLLSFTPAQGYPPSSFHKHVEHELVDGGDQVYRKITSDYNTPNAHVQKTYVINSDRISLQPKEKIANIHSRDSEVLGINEALECMLLRPGKGKTWSIEYAWEKYQRTNGITIEPAMDRVSGYDCYLMHIGPRIRVWFAPELGMLPLSYVCMNSEQNEILEEFHAQKVTKIKLKSGEWWWYSTDILWNRNFPQAGPLSQQIIVKYLNPDYDPKSDDFKIEYPENTKVWDHIQKRIYFYNMTDPNLIKEERNFIEKQE